MPARLSATVLAATALAAAAYAAATPPAHAGPCYGTTQIHLVCVHPENVSFDADGGAQVGDCVYLHSTQCTPVFVTLPSATTTGPLVSTHCGPRTC